MILAIDPGITGALALYEPDLNFLHTEALPVRWRMVNKKKKDEVDMLALFLWLTARKEQITEVIIERPTAMPGAGAASQFNFGKTCGLLEGLITGMGLPMLVVHPSVWKIALNVPSDKRRARSRAAKIFPTHAAKFGRADSEGQAEAAMLAYYGTMANVKQPVTTAKKPKGSKSR